MEFYQLKDPWILTPLIFFFKKKKIELVPLLVNCQLYVKIIDVCHDKHSSKGLFL